jgi:uncharacterized protein YndB with AHSA1/START domain
VAATQSPYPSPIVDARKASYDRKAHWEPTPALRYWMRLSVGRSSERSAEPTPVEQLLKARCARCGRLAHRWGSMSNDQVTHEVIVNAARESVFEGFASYLGLWWPLAYTFSGPHFKDAGIEPRVGGSWYERNDTGETLSWGEVRAYALGERLVVSFAIGADRKPAPNDTASEVEIRFVDASSGRTRVELTHRDFERHGRDADALRAGMNSPQGWPLILAEFRRWIHAPRPVTAGTLAEGR